jgi:hypothetical protein
LLIAFASFFAFCLCLPSPIPLSYIVAIAYHLLRHLLYRPWGRPAALGPSGPRWQMAVGAHGAALCLCPGLCCWLKCYRLALGPTDRLCALRYVSRDFRKNKSGPRTPPPRCPPGAGVQGSLGCGWSAVGGLPSTRNWSFRWPLSVTHQPAPGDTQGNVSRQLAEAVVWGGWSCTSAATHGQRALLRFFISTG